MLNNKRTILYIFIVIFLGFFLLINFFTPLMAEDYVLTVFPKDYHPGSMFETIGTMFARIQFQMIDWNVRIGDQLSIAFSCFDKAVFNILNSVMAVLFIIAIYIYTFKKNPFKSSKSWFFLLLGFAFIVVFQPALGEIFFWRTGSTNYLWSICLLLFFALPLRFYVGRHRRNILHNKVFILLHTILGFIAGFTNENTIIFILLLYAIVIIHDLVKKKKLPFWMISSMISLAVGYIILLTCPSTVHRIAYYYSQQGNPSLTIGDYFQRAADIISVFFESNLVLIITVVILAAMILIQYLIRSVKNKTGPPNYPVKLARLYAYRAPDSLIAENTMLLLLSFVSAAALVLSPYLEIRAFLLIDFFLVGFIMSSAEIILNRLEIKKTIYIIIAAAACVSVLCVGANIFKTYRDYYDYCLEREKSVEKAIETHTEYVWQIYDLHPNRILDTGEYYLYANRSIFQFYYGDSLIIKDEQ